ncbi:MAG: hypothetical protein KGJ82_10030 [Nitrospirota bacterium]|nr:hypothetical protein [Nitrospirota bacterium]
MKKSRRDEAREKRDARNRVVAAMSSLQKWSADGTNKRIPTTSVDNSVCKMVVDLEMAHTERLVSCLPEKWALCPVKYPHNILWLDGYLFGFLASNVFPAMVC